MPSRRDQLHSYQFMVQRVVSSIMVRETDPEQAPLRRGVGAVFAGVMISVLVAAGFGVVGALTGVGGDGWREDGSVIIERETGTRYVYVDGALRPVLNYASARLLGGQGAEPQRVAGSSLAGVPRAPTVGIPGAPDSLPPGDRVAGTPWTLCSVPVRDASGAPATTTALRIGESAPEGAPLGERAALVRDSDDGTPHLVWHNQRYRIVGERPEDVVRSLYGAGRPVIEVGGAWLNGLPSGQDIGPIAVEGRGSPSQAASDLTVGDLVYHPVGEGRQHYLVLSDGIAALTELQTRIVLGQYAVEPREVPTAVANSLPSSDVLAPATGEQAPPATPPELVGVPSDGTTPLCAETTDARAAPRVTIPRDAAGLTEGIPTTVESGAGTKLADLVLVPPGGAALVRALPSDRAETGAINLVTDVGIRYPVPSEDVLAALGYDPASLVDLPAALVQRIPEGPTLSPEAALRPAMPAQP
ncbi:type VII secretion protein EccB [Prauserella cavernicola]|uniref:Type VII secretion protein EccB n=1 Tax=Prauserella cavernicola TaxID=2800127 RepID=A0A934QNY9_9PSEU|nr:type VII secretion protein EccB [Prauserella cavernicola]MBK1783467.1 type VII secretion protein EccB [Prauserella cavernicola]